MSDKGTLFDVCIIGSGAGGGPAAADLARKGLRVALLERGKNYSRSDIQKNELAVCRKPAFRPGHSKGNREILYGNAPAVKSNHLWTGTCVGGGTRVMSGFFFRMKEEDFKPRSTFGAVEGATHQDWPITYQDLELYYDRVESDVGISGLADVMPEREKPFPFPPLKPHPVSKLIDKACNELGYHPFTTPRAVLSKEWKERGECSYSGFCGSYACMTGAKGSTDETYIKEGLATENLTLLDRHVVYRLETEGDKVVSACYFDRDNVPGKIRARIFIIACSAIETARLLLNSHSLDYPNGLSNSSGQVGKNLTFTVPCEVTGFFNKTLFPAPIDASSPFVQRTIQDFHTLDTEELSYRRGGSVLFILPHPNPINRMIFLSYNERGERIIGTALKEKARDYFSYNHLQSDTFIEYLPNPKTFVTLSHGARDYWGVPGAQVHFQPHAQNLIASRILAQKIARIFQVMGAEKIAYNPNPFTAGEIQQGTCRFGDDPKKFVLDRNCRSHDIKNLYITDGSFMPSGLPVPPTFTIMANSLRGSDYIYKNG
jgi:choline dehydrogenase-like flavoprotein